MFCEKCGNQVNEGERFCEKCGAPIAAAQAPAAPVQPQQAPQQTSVQPNDTQVPYTPQQYAPVPPAAPKKPLSKGAKMAILFSSIGVVVLAAILIVLFVVIIPAINRAKEEASKIDITKYFTVDFNGVDDYDENPSVFDGKISGEFKWDYEKFAEDQKMDESKASDIFYYIGGSVEKEYKLDGESASYYFSDASQDTTFEVTFTWPDSKSEYGNFAMSDLDYVKQYEKQYGVKFKHNTKTVKYNIGDLLKEQNISVAEPVDANILGYIKDNNLVSQSGYKDGYLSVSVGEFETTVGDFTFTKEADSNYVYVTDKNGKSLDSFELEFSDRSYLDDGETITIDYDSYDKSDLGNIGINLIGDPVSFTVKAPDPFTLETAKANVEAMKTYFNDAITGEDYSIKTGDTIELKNIYFCKSKDSNRSYVVFSYYNATQKYYKTAEVNAEYLYMADGELKSAYDLSTNASGKTLAEANENCWYLSKTYSKYYTNTQVL